jgi:hypothetical protein
MLTLESGPDPSCVERVSTPEGREEVYGEEPRFGRCVHPGGKLRGRSVGKVRLRMKRERVSGASASPSGRGEASIAGAWSAPRPCGSLTETDARR